MIGYPFIVIGEFEMNPLIGIVSIIQILIQSVALIILFTGEPEKWFPLRVMLCDHCWLVQTEDNDSGEELFYARSDNAIVAVGR